METLKVPQFNTTAGGLNFFKLTGYVFSVFIILMGFFEILGVFKNANTTDGLYILITGLIFYFLFFIFMKLIGASSYVIFYTDKIELASQSGKIKKCIYKQDIHSISAYEIKKTLPQQSLSVTSIPFETLDTAKSRIGTIIIYINKDAILKDIKSENAIFLHNNPDAVAWIRKYYNNLVKNEK